LTIPLQHRGVVSHISRGTVSAAALVSALLLVSVSAAAAQSGRAKSYKVLYRFQGEGAQGGPTSLVRDAAGVLYGTTEGDGAFGYGTVFELIENGKKKTVLHSFAGYPTDGAYPLAGLLRDAAGNLYGTTSGGGADGNVGFGTIFKIDTTGTETVLYSFTGGSDGRLPQSSLVMDAKGNLYGTTTYGGDLSCNSGAGCGAVFKLDTSGKERVLHSFAGPDGAFPEAGVIWGTDGNLYGTTDGGGAGYGTVFTLSKTGKERVLHSFTGSDGAYPVAGLVPDDLGNIYGTTHEGGTGCENGGCGTVFKLSKNGKETVLHSFAVSDGSYPDASVVRDDDGNLYGTTQQDGAYGFGTVFKVSAAGKETLLHAFIGGSDGANPFFTTLVRDADGNLYGTTFYGGGTGCDGFGCGTVFTLHP
jgi:uncharacterized repeat protein (TIGR03803 family)